MVDGFGWDDPILDEFPSNEEVAAMTTDTETLEALHAPGAVTYLTSETRQPPSPPGYADKWERGSDPWHPSAFIGTPAEGMWKSDRPRTAGWSLIDWCGNEIGFVADGTECREGD